MRKVVFFNYVWWAVFGSLFVTQISNAQMSASLRGFVTDPSGSVVPGASLAITDSAGRISRTKSDKQGNYVFPAVVPGQYNVDAFVEGTTADVGSELKLPAPIAIALRPGNTVKNIELQIVAAAQKLAVEGESSTPQVSTDTASNASAMLIKGKDLDALAEDPNALAEYLQALAGPSAGPNGGQIFVDGFSGGVLPSKDSIREIRINQNPLSPEFEKLGLGRIEILTKPGTDKFRGSAFYNFADDAWNSRNPY